MAELYPDGTAGVRSPSVLATVLALTAAVVLGAGAAVAVYALVDDEAVTTIVKTVEAPQVRTAGTPADGDAAVAAGAAVKDEAAVAAAIAREQSSSSSGVSAATAAKDEAKTAAVIRNP